MVRGSEVDVGDRIEDELVLNQPDDEDRTGFRAVYDKCSKPQYPVRVSRSGRTKGPLAAALGLCSGSHSIGLLAARGVDAPGRRGTPKGTHQPEILATRPPFSAEALDVPTSASLPTKLALTQNLPGEDLAIPPTAPRNLRCGAFWRVFWCLGWSWPVRMR